MKMSSHRSDSVSGDEKQEDAWVANKSRETIQEMFTAISPTYDMLNHALSLNIDKRWRKVLAKKTIHPGIGKILDVCGGTGDLSLALSAQAAQLNLKPHILCSDFTPAMTVIAKRKFAKAVFDKALPPTALVADTTALPFADNTFDLVTVAFGIRNVADPQAGLLEITRVCKPGGQVAVLEFSKTRNLIIDKGFCLYFSHILPTIGRAVTGTRAYSYLSKSVASFPEGNEFCAMLASATGTDALAQKLSFGIATLYLSRKKADLVT